MKPAHVLLIIALIAALAGTAFAGGVMVDIELEGAPMQSFLKAAGHLGGVNVIAPDDLGGTVTLSLTNVPLWDAVDHVLASRGYGRRLTGGMMVIAPEDEAARRERDLDMREFRLMYLEPDSALMDTVRGVMSARGSVTAVSATRALVVKDVPVAIGRVEALLKRMDQKPRQILIEAGIVEMETGFSRQIGVEWGARWKRVSGDVFGGLGSVEVSAGMSAPVVTDGAFNMGVGVVSDRVALSYEISALETQGHARVVSSPRLMVLENHRASIADAKEIVIPESASGTVVVAPGEQQRATYDRAPHMLDARLQLDIVPHIVEDGRVAMSIDIRREDFDDTRVVQGYPRKNAKSARTDLIVEGDQTVVIGGIRVEGEAKSTAGVPWFSRIPILGALFRHSEEARSENELLIFITPVIIEDERNSPATGLQGDIQK